MDEPNSHEAARLLDAAVESKARGAAAVRRPAWYPIGLGVCMAVALAGFAVPGWATTGVVIGGFLPMLLDMEARRRTGGSPARSYFEPPTRTIAVAAVLVGAVVAGASLVALKVTGQSWVVLPGALIIGVGTVATAYGIERLRAAASRPQAPRS